MTTGKTLVTQIGPWGEGGRVFVYGKILRDISFYITFDLFCFTYLEGNDKERDFPCTDSLPKGLQLPELKSQKPGTPSGLEQQGKAPSPSRLLLPPMRVSRELDCTHRQRRC